MAKKGSSSGTGTRGTSSASSGGMKGTGAGAGAGATSGSGMGDTSRSSMDDTSMNDTTGSRFSSGDATTGSESNLTGSTGGIMADGTGSMYGTGATGSSATMPSGSVNSSGSMSGGSSSHRGASSSAIDYNTSGDTPGTSGGTTNADGESHPVAFLGGGAAGAMAGAAVGAIAGPIGAIAGAAIGGFVGAETAEGMASMPESDENYWKENYKTRSYAGEHSEYDDYAPAYRAGHGASTRSEYEGKSFDDIEDTVRTDYSSNESARLDWDAARPAARDAYDRSIQLREERLRIEKVCSDEGKATLHKDMVSGGDVDVTDRPNRNMN